MQCNENTFLILQTLAYSEGFLPRPLKEPESASVSSEPIYLQSDARDTILCWSACVRCSIILFFVISDIQLSLLSSHSRAAGTEYFFPQARVAITHHGDGNGGWNGEPAPKPPGPTATYLWVWCSMQQSFFFFFTAPRWKCNFLCFLKFPPALRCLKSLLIQMCCQLSSSTGSSQHRSNRWSGRLCQSLSYNELKYPENFFVAKTPGWKINQSINQSPLAGEPQLVDHPRNKHKHSQAYTAQNTPPKKVWTFLL